MKTSKKTFASRFADYLKSCNLPFEVVSSDGDLTKFRLSGVLSKIDFKRLRLPYWQISPCDSHRFYVYVFETF